KSHRPDFLNLMARPLAERYRFRLMEMIEPSESFSLYKAEANQGGNAAYTEQDWFTTPLSSSTNSRVVAPNIVALVLLPILAPADQLNGGYTNSSLAPGYLYDSTGANMSTTSDKNLNPKNQLPPIVQVTMVAVDEPSFKRIRTLPSMPNLYANSPFTD